MIDTALPCSCCNHRRMDFQSLRKGRVIICVKCIYREFRKGKARQTMKKYCYFHEKRERGHFRPVRVRFLRFFKRKIWICSAGWSELFASCRKEM